MDANHEEIIGTSEAARRLGVPVSTLTYWDRIGAIPKAGRISGSGRRFFRESDLDVVRERIDQRRAERNSARAAA